MNISFEDFEKNNKRSKDFLSDSFFYLFSYCHSFNADSGVDVGVGSAVCDGVGVRVGVGVGVTAGVGVGTTTGFFFTCFTVILHTFFILLPSVVSTF